MAVKRSDELHSLFKNGMKPDENAFGDLIDSIYNNLGWTFLHFVPNYSEGWQIYPRFGFATSSAVTRKAFFHIEIPHQANCVLELNISGSYTNAYDSDLTIYIIRDEVILTIEKPLKKGSSRFNDIIAFGPLWIKKDRHRLGIAIYSNSRNNSIEGLDFDRIGLNFGNIENIEEN